MSTNPDIGNAVAENVTDDYFQKLAETAAQRALDRSKPFPPIWDPKPDKDGIRPTGPNPLQVARWPGLQKVMARNGDEWLKATVTHVDGSEWTIFVSKVPELDKYGNEVSSSLFKQLRSAGVEIGKPVSILRSLDTHEFGTEGHSSYDWQIGTQALVEGTAAGHQVYNFGELAAAAPAAQISRGGELPPDEVVEATVVDDIPFHNVVGRRFGQVHNHHSDGSAVAL